jgi:hypothetical protein
VADKGFLCEHNRPFSGLVQEGPFNTVMETPFPQQLLQENNCLCLYTVRSTSTLYINGDNALGYAVTNTLFTVHEASAISLCYQ